MRGDRNEGQVLTLPENSSMLGISVSETPGTARSATLALVIVLPRIWMSPVGFTALMAFESRQLPE